MQIATVRETSLIFYNQRKRLETDKLIDEKPHNYCSPEEMNWSN